LLGLVTLELLALGRTLGKQFGIKRLAEVGRVYCAPSKFVFGPNTTGFFVQMFTQGFTGIAFIVLFLRSTGTHSTVPVELGGSPLFDCGESASDLSHRRTAVGGQTLPMHRVELQGVVYVAHIDVYSAARCVLNFLVSGFASVYIYFATFVAFADRVAFNVVEHSTGVYCGKIIVVCRCCNTRKGSPFFFFFFYLTFLTIFRPDET